MASDRFVEMHQLPPVGTPVIATVAGVKTLATVASLHEIPGLGCYLIIRTPAIGTKSVYLDQVTVIDDQDDQVPL